MLRSMYSGISGMRVNQTKLDVIGNNIANVGTTSFKSSRTRFQDMLSQSAGRALGPSLNLGGVNPRQVGLGVQMAGIDTLTSQGMMQPTGRNLDMAMDGEGYFMVSRGPVDGKVSLTADNKMSDAGGMDVMYTRDGSFNLDPEGNLLTSDGFRVMGYQFVSAPATAPATPATLADVTTAVGDYNTAKTAGTPDPADIAAKLTTAVEKANQALQQAYGKLSTANKANPVVPADVAAAQKDIDDINTELDKAPDVKSQLGSSFQDANGTLQAKSGLVPLKIPQSVIDGGKEVRIISFSVEKTGLIKAVCQGGKVTVLGQLATASFNNPAGLEKAGGNLLRNSPNSGDPIFRTPVGTAKDKDNSGGYGDVMQGALEMSNVDLAEQFTDMITATRAFQAAGKTINTGDEILQDIINLKR